MVTRIASLGKSVIFVRVRVSGKLAMDLNNTFFVSRTPRWRHLQLVGGEWV